MPLSQQLVVDGALMTLLVTCPKEEWLANAGPTVLERINQYPEGELRFNLLAVVPERPDSGTFSAPGNSKIENLRRKVDYEAACHKLVTSLTADQVLFVQDE